MEVVVWRGGGSINNNGGGGSNGVMSWQCADAATCFVITLWEWYVVPLLPPMNKAMWCSGYIEWLCLVS